jgi:hypothetical protein
MASVRIKFRLLGVFLLLLSPGFPSSPDADPRSGCRPDETAASGDRSSHSPRRKLTDGFFRTLTPVK